MASEENGSHFGASSANMQQLEEFSIEETAQTMKSNAPGLWGLLGILLGEDERLGSNEDVVMSNAEEVVDDYYWDQVEAIELEGFINALTSEGDTVALKRDIHTNRRAAICNIKKVVILSIMMQSMNRKSNALQSIIGIFLQSMHTPQNVVDTLARIGISISTDAIHAAVKSMSAESQNAMRELGQSLLASYAYDNFDVDLKSHLPVVEKSNDSLKHLTSGLMFPLRHGITIDDLKCSEELWKQSALNTQAIEQDLPPHRTWKDLLSIHSKSEVTRNLTRRDRFNAWLFLMDLCTHGPEYFHLFKSEIPPPEVIEEIPLHKTSITAARAMDINNSTVSGNIRAVTELLAQGGIYDPVGSELESPDISQHVVLIHGDLGTGERLQAAQIRRSIEATPWDRLQHIIFIPGLFHLKMACADAIWRCFLQPLSAREDDTSLMRDITQLRPRETGIYCSKPGFRRMHVLIGSSGTCRRLDCWRIHVKNKSPAYSSLEEFAASKPVLNELIKMADELAQTYVANYKLHRIRRRPEEERDVQFENSLLMNKYFLLYEELSYAMNRGDIGRTETCIVAWIPILKATGKHKYATHMSNFLINLHFVYPPGLRRAIRYHILVNPTGKETSWRAVDWCVELNNLFTKVKNGGKGPNRTVERIFLESPLVHAYRNAQTMIQKNFLLAHLTAKHAGPNMRKTFELLSIQLAKQSPHIPTPSRKKSVSDS
ncbi:uncharacterized protein F5891DRAFT_986368 [Suillus fuscotomentosus]|uniref:DUF6589 domain-containing protein n=1 Tax=Suillus fuscotomentosus TaxID=1912939 RepID=A0AAD4DRY9_9AGAM|nr:uncharacterized protein F5891DRAFT_986368 [Suillus fuscotomentosus]KAG1892850.1 hypothetical protein F5891DRAFT_986368 [Suillus fuscotomentosus]